MKFFTQSENQKPLTKDNPFRYSKFTSMMSSKLFVSLPIRSLYIKKYSMVHFLEFIMVFEVINVL